MGAERIDESALYLFCCGVRYSGLLGGLMRSFRRFCRSLIKAKSSSTTAIRQMIMPIGASAARIDNHEISSEIKKPGPSIPGYPGSGFTNLWPRQKILVEAKT
jgi:hypothetical protein